MKLFRDCPNCEREVSIEERRCTFCMVEFLPSKNGSNKPLVKKMLGGLLDLWKPLDSPATTPNQPQADEALKPGDLRAIANLPSPSESTPLAQPVRFVSTPLRRAD